jgi:hypothetical protein
MGIRLQAANAHYLVASHAAALAPPTWTITLNGRPRSLPSGASRQLGCCRPPGPCPGGSAPPRARWFDGSEPAVGWAALPQVLKKADTFVAELATHLASCVAHHRGSGRVAVAVRVAGRVGFRVYDLGAHCGLLRVLDGSADEGAAGDAGAVPSQRLLLPLPVELDAIAAALLIATNRQVRVNGVIIEHAGQAVTAQQPPFARNGRKIGGVYRRVVVNVSQNAHEHRAPRMVLGLGLGDAPRVDQLLHERMVCRDLTEFAV